MHCDKRLPLRNCKLLINPIVV